MAAQLAAGSTFAGYRIEDEIGRGGMGVVYRATDRSLERPVALKLIAPELAGDEEFRSRFLRESKLAGSLGHPHVLPVYAAGEENGQLYLAMRFVEGKDLKSLLARERKLEPEQAFRICRQVAEALDAAHTKGLVHRDVKPANVLLDEQGEAYLADFGLTKPAGGSSTKTGELAGTLDYLAPEQIRGENVDGRTDEYALACCLYECVGGKPPFRRQTAAETLWAHMQEQPPSLREYPALEPVFARALSKDRDERFPSCVELVDSTREALGMETPRLRRHRLARRSRLLIAAGVLVLAGATAAAVVTQVGGGSAAPIVVRQSSLAGLDAKSGKVVASIHVSADPDRIAAGPEALWVQRLLDPAIVAVDPESREIMHVVDPRLEEPRDVAAGAQGVWVVGDGLARINPIFGDVVRTMKLPGPGGSGGSAYGAPTSIAEGAGAVWLAARRGLIKIKLGATPAVETIHLGTYVDGVAVGGGGVWAASGATATVLRLDPQTDRVTATIPLASHGGPLAPYPYALTVGEGFVWVLNGNTATLTKIDPRLKGVTATIPLSREQNPLGIAAGAGAVWLANQQNGTLSRIDPRTNAVETIELGPNLSPRDVVVRDGVVWVTVD
jgi:DNA-binding beta-propeller fold protein YncE/predicted Ser/Thr protein kinase